MLGRGPLVLDGIIKSRKILAKRDVARDLYFQDH